MTTCFMHRARCELSVARDCRCGGRSLWHTRAVAFAGEPSTAQSLLDKTRDDAGFCESGDVTELIVFVSGDLAQDATHDLAGPGLRQAGRPLNEVRRRYRPNLPPYPVAQFGAQLRSGRCIDDERHKDVNT